jgi:hypothetical protein
VHRLRRVHPCLSDGRDLHERCREVMNMVKVQVFDFAAETNCFSGG